MKLYRVYKYDYEVECTVGVFQSQYRAKEVLDEFAPFDKKYSYDVEELTLDEVYNK